MGVLHSINSTSSQISRSVDCAYFPSGAIPGCLQTTSDDNDINLEMENPSGLGIWMDKYLEDERTTLYRFFFQVQRQHPL